MKRFRQATLPQSMSRKKSFPQVEACSLNLSIKLFLHFVLFFSFGGRETKRRTKSDRKTLEAQKLKLDNLLASFPIRTDL